MQIKMKQESHTMMTEEARTKTKKGSADKDTEIECADEDETGSI